jgi:predicted RNA-binding Zn-ribbon protein involved in translation (DUF1610 family)
MGMAAKRGRRRAATQAATGLAVFVMSVAVASCVLRVDWEGGALTAAISKGAVYLWWEPQGRGYDARGWVVSRSSGRPDWWPYWQSDRFGRYFGWLPLWLPGIACAACAGVLRVTQGRTQARGMCGRCGYNLTGNVSGVCPECGTPISRSGEARRNETT